jgi:Tol biopolymer transport system component/DNA-binding winged helix-turn-helix (wHTH) protein
VPGEPSVLFYEFGPFRIDVSERLLLCKGEIVSLTPKAFDTLLALVQSSGRVLKKDELMQKIWPDTFVEEVNLAHHISVLRKALGNGENGDPYIQTVPRRGYRFAALVEAQAQEGPGNREEGIDSGQAAQILRERRFDRRLMWGSMVLLVFSVVGMGIWFIRSRPEAPVPLIATPLTSYAGSELQPSFSPDGTQVAFVWDGEKQDNFDIYVKLIGTSDPLRLTHHPGADWSPAWCPDGRSIAFLRVLTEGFALMTVPPLAGPEQKLLEVHGRAGGYVRGRYLAWSNDGKALVFSYSESPGEPLGLFLLSLVSREKSRLTSPPAGSIGDSAPVFSPDGHTLAFNRIVGVGTSDLYLLALSKALKPIGEPRRIPSDDRALYSPVWRPDKNEIIYETSPGLWRIAVNPASRPQRLAWVGQDGEFPAMSRQGHRLAYSRALQDWNIWRAELRGPHGQMGRPTRFIATTLLDAEPQFSPAGNRIVFSSNRSGSDEIWVCDSDGSNAFQLTSFGGPQLGSPRWSPDGTQVCFDVNVDGQFDVQVVAAEGGKPQRLTTSSADDYAPSWSHDAKWLYFGSTRSGRRQVWKMPAEGGEAVQVTRSGGFLASEAPDGNTVYYLKSEDKDQESYSTSLWRVPTQGGEETQVIESVALRAAAVTKDGIYFVPRRSPGSVRTIQFLSFATGKIGIIGTLEMPVIYSLTVSPDGRWISYSQIDQVGSDLMLVEDFR